MILSFSASAAMEADPDSTPKTSRLVEALTLELLETREKLDAAWPDRDKDSQNERPPPPAYQDLARKALAIQARRRVRLRDLEEESRRDPTPLLEALESAGTKEVYRGMLRAAKTSRARDFLRAVARCSSPEVVADLIEIARDARSELSATSHEALAGSGHVRRSSS